MQQYLCCFSNSANLHDLEISCVLRLRQWLTDSSGSAAWARGWRQLGYLHVLLAANPVATAKYSIASCMMSHAAVVGSHVVVLYMAK
jgi:hypothetical protein